jgi:CRISPR-associated protein Cas1
MIKRPIEVSTRGTFLSVRDEQLLVRLPDSEQPASIPVEDVGVLILATSAATYTHAVIARLLARGAVIVACDDQHLPTGLLLPQHNALQPQRLRAQIGATKPTLKRLWKQLVVEKIRRQADLLDSLDADQTASALRGMARRVRSGDPDNIEAQAARRYWPALMGTRFRRRQTDGGIPNDLLNYGYMALRAAIARALCGAGLHPSLGLHHSNRQNSFALADDLLEPFRPMVDQKVRILLERGCDSIDKDAKRELLGLLTETVALDESAGPLMVNLERMAASLLRCFEGKQKALDIPRPWN